MPAPTIIIKPAKQFTWERWQAGRAERRRLGNLVAPAIIRRAESSSDTRLRPAFDGERGPAWSKPTDHLAEATKTQDPADGGREIP